MLSREETTKIYAVNVCGFENRNLYLHAYNAVSEGRREKTDRLYSENDKRLSIGAEILLQYALKDAGISPLPPRF